MKFKQQDADLILNETSLAEIMDHAASCTLDLSHLPYKETQYMLILWGLQKYIESYSLQSQFEVVVNNGRPRHTKEDSPDSSD